MDYAVSKYFASLLNAQIRAGADAPEYALIPGLPADDSYITECFIILSENSGTHTHIAGSDLGYPCAFVKRVADTGEIVSVLAEGDGSDWSTICAPACVVPLDSDDDYITSDAPCDLSNSDILNTLESTSAGSPGAGAEYAASVRDTPYSSIVKLLDSDIRDNTLPKVRAQRETVPLYEAFSREFFGDRRKQQTFSQKPKSAYPDVGILCALCGLILMNPEHIDNQQTRRPSRRIKTNKSPKTAPLQFSAANGHQYSAHEFSYQDEFTYLSNDLESTPSVGARSGNTLASDNPRTTDFENPSTDPTLARNSMDRGLVGGAGAAGDYGADQTHSQQPADSIAVTHSKQHQSDSEKYLSHSTYSAANRSNAVGTSTVTTADVPASDRFSLE